VRIEDLDPQRSRPELERRQLEDLRALGIDWDEPPVRQSERLDVYERALAELAAVHRLYPCFCTRAEIREAASAPHGDLPEGAYPGTCATLDTREASRRIATGRPHAIRVRAAGERIEFVDRLHGPCSGVVDDFVVRRADGVPAYQLAVVVDDAEQRIGEVVRGDDLLDSTPRQLLLARLLELPAPRYAHVPLVLGPDGARLTKRHGAVTLADLGEPTGRTLAWLAATLGLRGLDPTGLTGPADLLGGFDPGRIPAEPVVLGACD
jgi:glutamyl-tRNA synthetase